MKRIALFLLTILSSNYLYSQTLEDTSTVRQIRKKIFDRRMLHNEPDSLFYYASKGKEIAKSIDDQYGIAEMDRFLGQYYLSSSDMAKSLEHFRLSIKQFEDIQDTLEMAATYSEMAHTYRLSGNYDKALDCYQLGLELLKPANIFEKSQIYTGLGNLYNSSGDDEMSKEMYQNAIALLETLNDTLNIIGNLLNLGNVYYNLKQYDSASMLTSKAIRGFEQQQSYQGMALAFGNMTDIMMAQGKLNEAFEFSRMSNELCKEKGLVRGEINSLIGMGMVKNAQKEYNKSIAYLRQASSLSKSENSNLFSLDIYNLLYSNFKSIKKPDSALFYLEQYAQLYDSIYNQESSDQLTNFRASYESELKQASLDLLEKDSKITSLYRNVLLVALSSLLLIGFLVSFNIIQKLKKDKKLLKNQQLLHETEGKLTALELESQKQKESELQKELEFRSKSLTTFTLNLAQKNATLTEIKIIAQEIIKHPQRKDSELKKMVKVIDQSFNLDKDWDNFKLYFDQVHSDFFKKLSESYPQLSNSEIKLCSLIRLSLNIKEAATILNISPESVKVARHRLRKKMALVSDDNLTSFLKSL